MPFTDLMSSSIFPCLVLLQPAAQLPVSLILLQEDVDIEYQEAGCFSVKMGHGDLFV